MPLPGLVYWIEDQYGTIWNDQPLQSAVHAAYFRRMMKRTFPEFETYLIVRQRDKKRPVPLYFWDFPEDREKEPKEKDHDEENDDRRKREEELHLLRESQKNSYRESEF